MSQGLELNGNPVDTEHFSFKFYGSSGETIEFQVDIIELGNLFQFLYEHRAELKEVIERYGQTKMGSSSPWRKERQ